VAVLGAQPASPAAAVAAAAAADAFKKSRRFMPLSNRAMNITLLFSFFSDSSNHTEGTPSIGNAYIVIL